MRTAMSASVQSMTGRATLQMRSGFTSSNRGPARGKRDHPGGVGGNHPEGCQAFRRRIGIFADFNIVELHFCGPCRFLVLQPSNLA
jgi:hypothetical protein